MSEDKREACVIAVLQKMHNGPVSVAETYVDAILAELRVPSEAMVVAGCNHENMGDMAGRWQAMIDAVGE